MVYENVNIFVYCGGKCGSTTLENTFKKNNYNVIRLHYNGEFKIVHKYDKNIFDILDNNKKNKKLFIIDSYRTPIERKISSFFHNINVHVPNYNTLSIQQLIDIFNNKFLKSIEEYHSINEVMNYYKVPLFNTFNFNDKYISVEKDNIKYIKLRFADISEWNKILSKIFDKNIVIHPDNLTKNKNIYNLSNEFKKNYKIPKSYLEHIKNNDKEFNVFVSNDEKKKYFEDWGKKSC